MAFILLRLLVLGVIAAAAEDVHITWSAPPRASLSCDAHALLRRPPPPLVADEAGGRPRQKLAVLWRRGNDELSNKRVSANGTLEVRRQNGSEGVYQCAIRHQGGLLLGYPVHLQFASIERKIYITINNETGVSRDRRQPLVLTCHVRSQPPAVIHWLKEDQPIQDSERFSVTGNHLIVNDTLNNASFSYDRSDTYTCIAENTILRKNRTASVWLNDLEGYPCPQAIVGQHQEQVLVTPSSNVTLACPATSCHNPAVTWHKETDGELSKIEYTSQLYKIENVDEVKSGQYWCTVSYDNGSSSKKMFNVTLTKPVTIELPPVSKEVIRALTVRFNCTATGYPKPNVTWYKDGKLLPLGGRYNIRKADYREELVVGAVTSDDAGIYQCFADNGYTQATSWAVLRVTGESPAIPRAVGCWPTGPNTVLFKWGLPGRYEVIAYTVQTSIAGDTPPGDKATPNPEGNKGQPHPNTEEEITVPKALYPYVFQVRAYIRSRNVEASDFSKGIVCQGQGVPVQFDVNNDSVTVSWLKFANQTKGIVQWILQTRRSGSAERNYTLDGSITSYTLPGPSSGLQVRVMGSRSERWLPQNWTMVPWSDVVVTGKEVGIPEELKVTKVGAHEFTLTWRCDAPACVQGYSVCYARSDEKEKCLSTNTETITITNLVPEMEYEVRVRVNALGSQAERQFSQPVLVTTQPLEAKEPYTFVQYKYTPNAVKVFWNGTGAHLVRYSQNITQPVEQWPSEIVADHFIELTNLQPSLTTYVMVMTPGYGEKNQPVLTIPPRGVAKETSYYLTGKQAGNTVGKSQSPESETAGVTPRAVTSQTSYYLSVGLPVGLGILCLLVLAAVCIWRRKKLARSPNRPRRRNVSPNDGDEEEASEMKSVGGGLVNGGGSKDAGEPLLNGHVHITENPQSKTPNGKMRKGRLYLDAFDLSRNDDQDTTMETVIDADNSTCTTYNLLDTSRRPEYDLSRSSHDLSTNNSFNKLPDDNMNSELTRSADFHLDNSKIQPTLQPNG